MDKLYDWIISDTHFFHKNVIQYAGRPENHNELMASNWRRLVNENQTVLHLGDVLMGYDALWAKIKRLPGKVSVLNTGNHDRPKKKAWLRKNWGWEFIPEFSIEHGGWDVLFSHRPEWISQSHLISRLMDDPGWKTINIHGHIHQNPDPSPYHINVCVERMNYQPVNLKELLDKRIESLNKIKPEKYMGPRPR